MSNTNQAIAASGKSSWKTPQNFLLIISIIVPITFSSWMALLNNFVVERAHFDGSDIGLLQTVREFPAFSHLPLSFYSLLSVSSGL